MPRIIGNILSEKEPSSLNKGMGEKGGV